MSLVRFVCPHCEKQAEVQVTSVTRSRSCPYCGNTVLLQVSHKEVKGTRRALLIEDDPESVPVEVKSDEHHSISGPAYEPVALEGDVFERMKMDPELKVFRRRLYVGTGVVAGLVVLACIWSWFFQDIFMGEADPVYYSAPVVVTPPIAEDAPLPKNTVGLRHSEQKKGSPASGTLNFQSATNTNPKAETPPAAATADERAKKVMAVVEKFLHANNVDTLLETVARRAATEPLIRAEAAKHALKPFDYKQIKLSSADIDEAGCEVAAVVDLSDGSQRLAYVMMEGSDPKVEWPSFVRWSAMPWAKFMEKKPRKPVLFRVMAAEETQRFDHEFVDSKGLRCIRLTNPNDAKAPPLYAYAERTGSIGDEIEFLLRQSPGKPIKLTLRLKYPVDVSSNDQVWIDSVVEAGWVISDAQSNAQAAVVK